MCMSYEEEPRYCVNCGQPLINAAEMFLCWMCEEEEEQRLLGEEAEKEDEDTDDDDLFDDELEEDEDYEGLLILRTNLPTPYIATGWKRGFLSTASFDKRGDIIK